MSKKNQAEIAYFTVRIPAQYIKLLDEICEIQSKSRNQAIADIIAQYIESEGDFIGSRRNFRISLQWALDAKFGQLERLMRQYNTMMINMIGIASAKRLDKILPLAEMAIKKIDEADAIIYPQLKAKADKNPPAKPKNGGPEEPSPPKE
jgi:hypothetical protein